MPETPKPRRVSSPVDLTEENLNSLLEAWNAGDCTLFTSDDSLDLSLDKVRSLLKDIIGAEVERRLETYHSSPTESDPTTPVETLEDDESPVEIVDLATLGPTKQKIIRSLIRTVARMKPENLPEWSDDQSLRIAVTPVPTSSNLTETTTLAGAIAQGYVVDPKDNRFEANAYFGWCVATKRAYIHVGRHTSVAECDCYEVFVNPQPTGDRLSDVQLDAIHEAATSTCSIDCFENLDPDDASFHVPSLTDGVMIARKLVPIMVGDLHTPDEK